MWLCVSRAWHRTSTCTVPTNGPRRLVLICGITNLLLFGVGTIILGVANDCLEDVVIGALQLCLPLVGWIWSIVWGVLILIRKLDEAEEKPDGATP